MGIGEILGIVFTAGGLFFSVVGVFGMTRLPDIYTRLHATGKVSTVGLCGLLIGAAFLLPEVTLKMIALTIFAVLTLPVSTHVIAAAAYHHHTPMAVSSRDDFAEYLAKHPRQKPHAHLETVEIPEAAES
jgi:multicomponent Na+:H+ antiporter subunit G